MTSEKDPTTPPPSRQGPVTQTGAYQNQRPERERRPDRERQNTVDFLHSREYLSAGDVVVLKCDTQCNFRLTDDGNFHAFKRGGAHSYYGGFYTTSRPK